MAVLLQALLHVGTIQYQDQVILLYSTQHLRQLDIQGKIFFSGLSFLEYESLYYYIFFFNSFLGPISSVLVNKYGSRPVMIAGGCLSGCGLIAASFCNTVQELYLCIGVIGGE